MATFHDSSGSESGANSSPEVSSSDEENILEASSETFVLTSISLAASVWASAHTDGER